MPIHRLNEKPTRSGILADLTCDSDGKVDQFIDLRDVKDTLELALVTLVMDEEDEAFEPGCVIAATYCDRAGRHEEAERFRERQQSHEDMMKRIHEEREIMNDRRYDAHGLGAEALLALQLVAKPRIAAAYLARRRLSVRPDPPLYVLGLKLKRATARERAADRAFARQLSGALPAPCHVILINEAPADQARIFARLHLLARGL